MAEATLFLEALEKYQEAPKDNPLNLVIITAALDGVVLLKDGRTFTAKNGAYSVSDLLLPRDPSETYNGAGLVESDDLFPAWIFWNKKNGGYPDYTARALAGALVKARKLTRHEGNFLANGEAISEAELIDQISRSLAIIRKDPDQYTGKVFAALKAVCKDDVAAGKRERLSRDIIKATMQTMDVDIRFNAVSADFEVVGRTDTGRIMGLDDLTTLLHETLAGNYIGVSMGTLEMYTAFIGREQTYNPILDLLYKTEWDEVDRLPQVYQLLGVEDDALSKALVKKWLLQTVALLYNDIDKPFNAEGVLVLNTAGLGLDNQGAGKSTFFQHLALKYQWFGDGLSLDDRDKDTARRTVTGWITELGEIESTFKKADVARLKAFISTAVDRYRLPYGRSDIVAPRHTSLCATCNSDRFLVDQTGNRRFWTIPLQRVMPFDEIQALDALQLWAQVFDMLPTNYDDMAACFRLTEDERHMLAVRNGAFEKPLKAQVEVQDILDQVSEKNLQQRVMSVTEFKTMWNDELRNYPANQISAALRACGVEIKHTNQGSKALLPTPYLHG